MESGSLLCWLFPTYPQTHLCPSLPRPGARVEADPSPLRERPPCPGLLVGVSQTQAPRRLRAERRGSWLGDESAEAVARGLGCLAEGHGFVDSLQLGHLISWAWGLVLSLALGRFSIPPGFP